MFINSILLFLALFVISIPGVIALETGVSQYLVWGSFTAVSVIWMIVRRKAIFKATMGLEGLCAGLMLIKGIMELSYLAGGLAGIEKGAIGLGYLALAFLLALFLIFKKR